MLLINRIGVLYEQKKISILIFIFILIMGTLFYLNKYKIYKPSISIKIGYKENDAIIYPINISDYSDQSKVDTINNILWNSRDIEINEIDYLDIENPDLYIQIVSPRIGVIREELNLWFEGEEVIINWDSNRYRKIDENNIKTLKYIIDFSHK